MERLDVGRILYLLYKYYQHSLYDSDFSLNIDKSWFSTKLPCCNMLSCCNKLPYYN